MNLIKKIEGRQWIGASFLLFQKMVLVGQYETKQFHQGSPLNIWVNKCNYCNIVQELSPILLSLTPCWKDIERLENLILCLLWYSMSSSLRVSDDLLFQLSHNVIMKICNNCARLFNIQKWHHELNKKKTLITFRFTLQYLLSPEFFFHKCSSMAYKGFCPIAFAPYKISLILWIMLLKWHRQLFLFSSLLFCQQQVQFSNISQ